jgi:hypothetical protein
MTVDFQTWMRAVWTSIMEPTESARKAIEMNVARETLWTALALIAVVNVILVVLLQMNSPAPVAFQEQAFALSPFGFVAIISIFLVMFVFGVFYAGQIMGGTGTLHGSLTIIVWFQSISLTLEAIQLVLVVISPAIASIFGLLSLGALIWCFLNFINVLHGFKNLGTAFAAVFIALLGTALLAGIILAVLGVGPAGGVA